MLLEVLALFALITGEINVDKNKKSKIKTKPFFNGFLFILCPITNFII
jgi:hypothetical protein